MDSGLLGLGVGVVRYLRFGMRREGRRKRDVRLVRGILLWQEASVSEYSTITYHECIYYEYS